MPTASPGWRSTRQARPRTACRARSWKSSTRSSTHVTRGAAEGADRHLGKTRLHRRRRHQGVRRASARPTPAYQLIRQGQQVLDRSPRCPAPPSPPSTASRSAAGSKSHSRAAIGCWPTILPRRSAFPEVQLGVHPGFGGTVRAVQLAGPIAAMDLMLTGRSIRPKQALADGPGRSARAARTSCDDVAKQVALNPPPHAATTFVAPAAQLWRWCGRSSPARCARRLRKRARPDHYPAPYALIELWQRLRRQGRACLRGRSALDGAAAVHADLAQPGARVLPAGTPEVRRQEPAASRASMCTSSAPASWAATSRAGARRAA